MQKQIIKIFLTQIFFLTWSLFLYVPSVFADTFSGAILVKDLGYITNPIIHIPGGNYALPYDISAPNTEYILDGDIFADSTALVVNASKVVINLNGHTITYNQVSPGVGIGSGDYNKTDVAIVNGSIVQGAAMSTGVVYGIGSNPVRFHSGTPASYNVARVQIAGVYARYGSQDVAGIQLGGDGHLVEESTIEDTFEYGIVTDRHSGLAAIKFWGAYSVARNNTLINVRQRGIDPGSYGEIYGNTIGIRSICTNSIGISAGETGVKVYNNTITGRGEHPIGIAVGNDIIGVSHDSEIHNNVIDTQVTRLGTEYGGGVYPSDALTSLHNGDNAVGIRCTTGTTNTMIRDNTIVVHSDSDFMGTWSPDGRPVRMSGGARGLMTGLRYNGQSLKFYNNTIAALDKDGTGYAVGMACDANIDNNNWYTFRPPAVDFGPALVFEHNIVTSNMLNIAVGDEYGPCSGSPLFIKNTLVKADNYPAYATYGSALGGYYEGTGRFISNIYQGGAAENSLDMNFQSVSNNVPDVSGSYRNKDIIFGHLQLDDYIYYDYRLHNNLGTTGSPTPINVASNEIGPLFIGESADTIAPSAPSGFGVQ